MRRPIAILGALGAAVAAIAVSRPARPLSRAPAVTSAPVAPAAEVPAEVPPAPEAPPDPAGAASVVIDRDAPLARTLEAAAVDPDADGDLLHRLAAEIDRSPRATEEALALLRDSRDAAVLALLARVARLAAWTHVAPGAIDDLPPLALAGAPPPRRIAALWILARRAPERAWVFSDALALEADGLALAELADALPKGAVQPTAVLDAFRRAPEGPARPALARAYAAAADPLDLLRLAEEAREDEERDAWALALGSLEGRGPRGPGWDDRVVGIYRATSDPAARLLLLRPKGLTYGALAAARDELAGFERDPACRASLLRSPK